MKHSKKLGLALILLMAPLLAAAGPSYIMFWHYNVVYTNGTSSGQLTATQSACQALYLADVLNPPPGAVVDYSKTRPCQGAHYELPVLVDDNPWDDYFVSVLTADIVKHVYPERYREVANLMHEFDLASYQEELRALQNRYNMREFEQQLSELEQSFSR